MTAAERKAALVAYALEAWERTYTEAKGWTHAEWTRERERETFERHIGERMAHAAQVWELEVREAFELGDADHFDLECECPSCAHRKARAT